jgi:hypothetical protein
VTGLQPGAARQPGPVEGWAGGYRHHDVVKEIVVAVVLVALAVVLLAALFGSPRVAAITFQRWATDDPVGFLGTTLAELDGTSATAQYGPPYTDTAGAGQSLFGLSPARWVGVHIPVDTADDMVLRPLGRLAVPGDALAGALAAYRAADAAQRAAWTEAYATALEDASVDAGAVTLPEGDYGPLASMMGAMLGMAQSGAIDAALIDDVEGKPGFFVFDYTDSLLYLADGDYFAAIGDEGGVAGDQWGMANTVGNWPGQPWLLPVSFWYQIPPASTSDNGDLIVLSIVGVLALAVVFLPFIPGLRVLPLKLRVYRLIWRGHYRDASAG